MNCRNVLIVEDDEDIRASMREVLEFEGYTVFEAEHGKEALEVLAKMDEPCVVLLDLMMPVMNGWEFVGALDHLPKRPKVVIVSAAGERTPAPHAEAYVRKPIELNQLLDTLQQYC